MKRSICFPFVVNSSISFRAVAALISENFLLQTIVTAIR